MRPARKERERKGRDIKERGKREFEFRKRRSR
jgi:hypothetical protein